MNATTAQTRTEEDLRWLSIATLVASVLSLVGGVCIAYGIAVQTRCFRCHRHQSPLSRENPTVTTLIMSMTIADLLQSITFIAGAGATLATASTEWMFSNPVLCEAQGFLLQVFAFATPMWVLAISVTLHRLVVKGRESGFKFIMVVSAVCWGTALLLGIIPFTFSRETYGGWAGYGPTGAWCWIHTVANDSGSVMGNLNTTGAMVQNFEQWVLFYLELVIIFFAVLGFSLHMVAHIHRQYATSQMWAHWKKRQGHVIRRLLLFPFCFMLAWSGGITSHVWSLFHPNEVNFALGIFHACTVCSQGWLNAVAYGATNQKLVRAVCEHWAQACCRCRCCSRTGEGARAQNNNTWERASGGGVIVVAALSGRAPVHATVLRPLTADDDGDLYDDEDDVSSELSRSTSASEMVMHSSPASVENIRASTTIGAAGPGPSAGTGSPDFPAAHRFLPGRDAAESVSSRSSLPAGTSPYSLLRM